MKLLLNSTQNLRSVVSFSGDLDFSTIKPAIREAQQLVARYVGDDLLEELATDSPSADQTDLLEMILVPIGNLTLLSRASTGNIQLTDSGSYRTKSDSQNDAFQWQLEETKKAFLEGAYNGLEELLRYLGKRLDTFPAYRDSEVYKRAKSRLIQSAAVFSDYYDIKSSRLILSTLDASMRTVERTTIMPLLGDQLADLLADELTDEQETLLDAARRALVYLTMARALKEKLVIMTGVGVQVAGISQFASVNYHEAPGDKQLLFTIATFETEAATFLSTLKTLLNPAPTTPTDPTGVRVMGTSIVAF
jgi:hypothetical protein